MHAVTDDDPWRVLNVAGRRLEVLTAGAEGGRALVFHSGTPSAAIPFPPLVEASAAAGLRLVTWSRPGYGDSSPAPGRTVADVAADTAAVLDALGIGQFLTLGWSGGGPHALACAALLPGRCVAAATLAGVAPYAADGLDWLAGMAEENVAELSLAREGERALTPWLEEQAAALADVTGADIAQSLGGLISAVDTASLTEEFADYLAATFRRAVSTGIAGWRDDDLAFVRDWGFDVASIDVPVSVWQGSEDLMVPPSHGRWLTRRLPRARDHVHPGEGHLSLAVGAMDRIVSDLVDSAG
ncbi:MAG: alpha/beta hydrolase [Blastococcus sp.]|jgi:pimeloyl-ACP methyl ester carboxylesterase|nr:alpha/beta hydrolase [Blastococcus sp.]